MPFVNENKSRKRGIKGSMACLALAAVTLAGVVCSSRAEASDAPYPTAEEKAKIDRLIVFYAKRYDVPVSLAREVVRSESEYRPLARNGPYWGLMQIRYDTAKAMGYDGQPVGLLDAETNLAFGVAYLANAYKAGGENLSRGHMLYRTGYYYEARRKRVLDEMITVDDFKPVGQSAAVIAAANAPETGELWSGDVADVPLGDGMAPLPRHKPGEQAQPMVTAAAAPLPVAAPVVVQAAMVPTLAAAPQEPADGVPLPKPRPVLVASSAPGAPPVMPPARGLAELRPVQQKSLAELRALAAASAGSEAAAHVVVASAPGPAVARPTVVYASVLPLSHAQPFEAPALAPAQPTSAAAAAISEEVANEPVADASVPLPRPRPVMAETAAPVVVASVNPALMQPSSVPLPRPRPVTATP